MKNLFFIITATFLLLFASCSREEGVNFTEENGRVSITAELSENAVGTRVPIHISATHKLRCIIEVWTKESSPVLVHREEVAIEAGALPPFEFDLPAGDYNCLMWADFIEKGATTTSITSGGVTYDHFDEVYYNTSNLYSVSILDGKAANLFDTDLCDAFFAKLELKKEEGSVSEQLKLTRPFAQLIIKEKDAEKFAELKKMKVTYDIPQGFNVSTGEPTSETLEAIYEKEVEDGDDSQVLFTNYIFTPSSAVGKALGTVSLSFTTASKMDCEIAAGSIIIRRNEKAWASGNLIEDGTIDPGSGPDPEPEDPQVGDFYFIDGTWGSQLTANNKANCVGIIYAVGSQAGDNISAYGESAAGKQILGYVMGLNNMAIPADLVPDGANPADYVLSDRIYFYKQANGEVDPDVEKFPKPDPAADWMTYDGYSITKNMLATSSFVSNGLHYPALYCHKLWTENASTPGPQYASDWYLPSGAQLLDCIGKYYGFAGKADANPVVPAINRDGKFAESLDKAIAEGIARNFANGTASARNVMSVSLSRDAAPLTLQPAGSNITVPNFTWKLQGFIRPVFTIIK